MADDTGAAAKAFTEALLNEVDNVQKVVLPLLKEMLTETRAVRMAINQEVVMIVQTYGTLQQTAKHAEEMRKLAESIHQLTLVIESIPPHIKVKLEDLFHS